MTKSNITTIAPYPAVIANMMPNVNAHSINLQFARESFEREMTTLGKLDNFERDDIGYTDPKTHQAFQIFFIGYRIGREEE